MSWRKMDAFKVKPGPDVSIKTTALMSNTASSVKRRLSQASIEGCFSFIFIHMRLIIYYQLYCLKNKNKSGLK